MNVEILKNGNSSPGSPIVTGSLWMLGTVLSLSSIAIGARQLAPQMTHYEMVFFRALFSMLALLPFIGLRVGALPRTRQLPFHLVRNLAHYCAQTAWFYGITLLPLATVFAIEFSTPIWSLLLAVLLLGEKFTRRRIMVLVLGLLGVLIILRPGLVPFNLASLAVLFSAFFFATSHIYTSKLTVANTPLTILFYMSLIQVPVSLVPALLDWSTPEGVAWFWLTLLAAASLTAHYCLSRALAIADAGLMIPIDYLRLPLIILVGYLFYQEALDWFVLLGAAIIVTGNFLNIRHEHGKSRLKTDEVQNPAS